MSNDMYRPLGPRWEHNTPQQPTIGILQPVTIPSTGSSAASSTPQLVGVYYGTGAPTFSAPNGTLYIRFDGAHATPALLYINTSGASTVGTTWTAIA